MKYCLPFLLAGVLGATQPSTPTFSRDVAPILQARCQECHHAGSMAPMSLVTYEETRPWAKSIRQRVILRQMPPWHIDPTVGVQKFKNDMSLTDEQISTIVRWVDSGAPMGDPKDMPAPEEWPRRQRVESRQGTRPAGSGHQVRAIHHGGASSGRLVAAGIEHPRHRAALGARGRDAARNRRRPQNHASRRRLLDPRRSGNFGARRQHRLGRSRHADGMGDRKGYDLYRPNTGKLLLPGAQISWDVHIHAVGEEIRDDVELGIWFYPKGQEPKYRTYLTRVSGAARIRVVQRVPSPSRPEYRHPAQHRSSRPTTLPC